MPGKKLRSLEELEKEFEMKKSQDAPNESRRSRRRAKKAKAKQEEATPVEPEAPKGRKKDNRPPKSVAPPMNTEDMTVAIKAMLRGPTPKSQVPVHAAYDPGAIPMAYTAPWFGAASLRQTGTVKKLVEGKGFGFVEADEYVACFGDIFLHFSDMRHGSSAAGALQVGSRVSFQTEIDFLSGRGRARDILPVTDEVTAAMKAQGVQDTWVEMHSTTYSKSQLLSVFNTMRAKDNRRRTWKSSAQRKLGIRTLKWSPDLSDDEDGEDDTQPRNLDDCDLLAQLETRLSRESGADAKNAETFGAGCDSGWSFEEAVKANVLLREKSRFLVPWEHTKPEDTPPKAGPMQELEAHSTTTASTPTEPTSPDSSMSLQARMDYLGTEWIMQGSERVPLKCQ